jgi:hypothetical protein
MTNGVGEKATTSQQAAVASSGTATEVAQTNAASR